MAKKNPKITHKEAEIDRTKRFIEREVATSLATIIDAENPESVAYQVGKSQAYADLLENNGYGLVIIVKMVKK